MDDMHPTSGPWMVNLHNDVVTGWLDDNGNLRADNFMPGNWPRVIAKLPHKAWRPLGQRLADAAMIAAAPELYATLAECRTDLMIAAGNADNAAKTDPRWEGVGEKLRERVRQADVALAAARGEAT